MKLSPLSKTILEFAREVPVFAPSQIFTWEHTSEVLRQCHNLVRSSHLQCARKGVAGNPSKLLTYKETLFCICEKNKT